MNAFINHQKAVLRLRRDHRLFNLNGSSIGNKYYFGSTSSQVQLKTSTNNCYLPLEFRLINVKRPITHKTNTIKLLTPPIWNYSISRNINTSRHLFATSSSKVEDVVKNLKEVDKDKQEQKQDAEKLIPAAATAASVKKSTTPSQQLATVVPETTAPAVKRTLRQKIWAELVHYYHGFRLLFIDINVCRRYLWKILNGQSLTRREHRLLIRTTSDLFRLLPFSVFIIVPFMELLLPLAIKLFPGMLPSTFQSVSDQDIKIKQNLKVKIEMAKFLQKTLDDMTVQHKDHRSEAAKDFSEFFQRVRTTGDLATNQEIIKFSKLFEDEITLDSLNRQQLLALCRVLEANCLGTSNFLRFQLRMKLRSLAADDRMIQKEGIDSLNLSELQSACRARGMRAYGISEERLKGQLQEWINLSLNEKVPPSLLLLSRALMLPENVEVGEKLKATLAALPETVATQTKAAIGEREGKIDNKTKIEIIKEEERKIKEEQEELKEAEDEIKAKEKQKQESEILLDQAPIISADSIQKPTSEQISQMFMEQKVMQQEEKLFVEKAAGEKELSSADLKVLGDALGTISKEKKNLIVEKEEIKEIKEEIAEYQEDVQELEEIVEQNKDASAQLKESRAAKMLYKKVNSMINKLDKVLDDLEKKEKEIKVLIEEPSEITEAEEAFIAEEAKRNAELVKIDELMGAIRKIQKVSDESVLEQIEKILGRIDDDQDGQLKVEDVLKVIETIGKESVQLNQKQLHEILDLIDKEEILETEEKIVKALKKEQVQRQSAKEQIKDDFSETEGKFLLEDKAQEIGQSDAGDNKSNDDPKIDPEFIKKVVENQNEKILQSSNLPPPSTPASPKPASPSPKDKVI